MKKDIYLIAIVILAFLVAITAFRTGDMLQKTTVRDIYADRDAIACAPPDKSTATIFANRRFVPLPGWGNHTYKITTTNDSAQYYFNQGLNLFYSFHLGESRASFEEAQRQDSSCAMAYWGYAMASGPIINNTNYSYSDAAIIKSLAKAYELTNDPVEKDLIKAQQVRYVADTKKSRRELFIDYREAMKALHEKYPDNVEVATLYADAAMMVDARNWYDVSGKPYDGTDEVIALLEKVMQKDPDHPALLHYYIHIVEPSHTPQRALNASDKLLGLMPMVAHMTHMPSHIYIRTGDYKKGIVSNQMAVNGYDSFRHIIKNGWEGSRHLYLYHNKDMQGSNALMMGNYQLAREAFDTNAKRFKKEDADDFTSGGYGHYVQFLTVQPYLLNVRFGKWKAIIAAKKPVSQNIAHKLYWHFGQGMAKAKTKKLAAAHASLQAMKELMKDTGLEDRMGLRSRTIDIMQVPVAILEGTIALAEKRNEDAIRFLTASVNAEDTLHYAEPESWRIPARHYLGQAYLKIAQFEKATKIFEEDLADHPNNFWSINGLKETLYQQFKLPEMRAFEEKHKTIFEAADIKLKGAAY